MELPYFLTRTDLTGEQARATKAFAIISLIFVLLAIPLDRLAAQEVSDVSHVQDGSKRITKLINRSILDRLRMDFPPANNYVDEGLSEPGQP